MEPRYSPAAQALHWVIGLTVIGLLILGLLLHYDVLPKPVRPTVGMLHMSFGLAVLALMVVRVVVRLTGTTPPLPGSVSPAIRFASWATQAAFYVLLLAMPVFGVLFVEAHGHSVPVFGLFNLPMLVGPNKAVHTDFAFLHFWGGITLIVLLVLHVGGAIRHQLQGERILIRMMPRRSH